MPVAQGPQVTARNVLVIGMSAVLVAGLLVLMFWILLSRGNTTVVIGDQDFNAGNAVSQANAISEAGPILYPDLLSGGQRDIYLTHQGDDPTQGWLAFAARRAQDPRECYFEWDNETAAFYLTSVPNSDITCEPATVNPLGTGLRQYRVEVRGNNVHILLYQTVQPSSVG